MSSLNLFFHWNSLLIPPLGLLLNFGLFWLILHRTPKEMWMHSRILLQTCIFDISILAIAIIGMPNVMFTQTKLILFFDGYLIHFYQHLFANYQNRLWHLYLFYIFVFHFDFFAIAVQFLYRYLLLNWDIRIKLWQYSALLFIPFIAAICISFINNSFMVTPIQNPFESINFSNLAIDFNEKPIFMAFLLNESSVMNAYLMYIPFYGLTYSIIIFCGIKMVRHIAIRAMHEHLKELNKQLTKTLIILAIYPLFYSVLIISILFPAILSNSMENASLFVVSLIDWILILNPLASIWTFRPYRDTLIGAVKRARRIVPK